MRSTRCVCVFVRLCVCVCVHMCAWAWAWVWAWVTGGAFKGASSTRKAVDVAATLPIARVQPAHAPPHHPRTCFPKLPPSPHTTPHPSHTPSHRHLFTRQMADFVKETKTLTLKLRRYRKNRASVREERPRGACGRVG